MGAYSDIRDLGYTDEVATKALVERGFSEDEINNARSLYNSYNGIDENKSKNIDNIVLDVPDSVANIYNRIKGVINDYKKVQSFVEESKGFPKAAKQGFDESVMGILINNELPPEYIRETPSNEFNRNAKVQIGDLPKVETDTPSVYVKLDKPLEQELTDSQELVKNTVNVVADTPIYLIGGALGGLAGAPAGAIGSAYGASAGAFGIHAGMRHALIEMYQTGGAKNVIDFYQRMQALDRTELLKEEIKGATVGALTKGAGNIAKAGASKIINKTGLKSLDKEITGVAEFFGEVMGLTGSSSIIENQEIPSLSDFTESAALLMAIKGVNRGIKAPIDMYKKNKAEQFSERFAKATTNKLKNVTQEERQNVADTITRNLMYMYEVDGINPKKAVQQAAQSPQMFQKLVLSDLTKTKDTNKSNNESDVNKTNTEENKSNLEESDIYRADKSMINIGENPEYKDAPVRLQNIVRKFIEDIDIVVDKGYIRRKESVRGYYVPKQEYVRTRSHNDMSVLSHESGHHLEKILFGKVDSQKVAEFESELGKIATKGSPSAEGFAEFISYLVMRPEVVQEKTPKFYEFFNKEVLDKNKELQKKLKSAQEMVKKWREQPSDFRVKSQIAFEPTTEKGKISKAALDLYIDWVDGLYILKYYEDKILERNKKRTGKKKKLEPADSPYALARLYKGVGAKIEEFLIRRTFDTELKDKGEPLRRILKDLKNDQERKDFSTYLVAKHNLDLVKYGIETGISAKDSQYVVSKYEPKYKSLAERIYKYEDALLDYMVESGTLSVEKKAELKNKYPHYVPFEREIPELDTSGRTVGSNIAVRNPIKKIKGSDYPVIDPTQTLIRRTAEVIANSDRNMILQKLVELSQIEGGGVGARKIPFKLEKVKVPEGEFIIKPKTGGMLKGNELQISTIEGEDLGIFTYVGESFYKPATENKSTEIRVLYDGKPSYYTMDRQLASFINGLDKQTLGWWVDIHRKFAATLRTGATLDPSFLERNPVRDTFEAFMNSDSGFIPILDTFIGMAKLGLDRDLVSKWKRSGGALATMVSTDAKSILEKHKVLIKTNTLQRAWNVLNPISLLGSVSEFMENSTRIREYERTLNKAIKEGKDEYEAMIQAGFASREATIDFARVGLKMNALNAMVAFTNAKVQGNDKLIRNIIYRPIKTLETMTALGMISVLFNLGWGDDEDVKDVRQLMKDTHWIFKSGDTIYRIPIPQNYAPLHIFINKLLDYNPDMKEGLFNYLTKDITVGSVISSLAKGTLDYLIPNLERPIIEQIANESLFFNSPIVPKSLEYVLPENQYTEYTTELSKTLGSLLSRIDVEISPMYIDNYIRGWGGGAAMTMARIADRFLTDEEKADYRGYETNPFYKGFIINSTPSMSKSYNLFWKKAERITLIKNTARQNQKQGSTKYSDIEPYYQIIKNSRDVIINIGDTIKAVTQSKDIPDEEKSSYVQQAGTKQVEIAKKALIEIEKLNEKYNLNY